MDHQATKTIKAYLTLQQVMLQLVKPHNHWVNTTERANQILKNRFIGALGTTNSMFPIQLRDKLAPQVQDCINLLQRSRIALDKSAYEMLEGLYDFNYYPLSPLSTRAIIYKDLDMRAPWAPHGLDAWYLGSSKDHCHCHHYYVLETRGYRTSGFADLISQHCREPLSHITAMSGNYHWNSKKTCLPLNAKLKLSKSLNVLHDT